LFITGLRLEKPQETLLADDVYRAVLLHATKILVFGNDVFGLTFQVSNAG
jgi:hypothetical protein